MTRHTPGGEGYQGSPYDAPQQPQYGQSGPQYGNYSSGEYQQGYNQPASYEGSNQGSAQGYYGTNDQPYQQYPHDRPPPPENYYQGPPESSYPPQYNQHQYGGPPPPHYDQRQQYGSPQPGYAQPQYNQGYPAPPQQWDQHNNPTNMPPYGAPPPGQYPPGPAGPGQTEEDRGLMGALAGGAAGAYGGHKMNHGILGGIGGAVAGSMLEDAYKKKHEKEKKPKKSRRGSSSSSSSSSSSDSDSSKKKKKHGGGRALAGNFHASSRSVRIEGRSMLVADCADKRGHLRQSALELNDCFTNTNGKLAWARGGNFAASARGIRLADNGKVMECELGNGRGGWERNWVRLDERITNEDGQLRML